MPRPSDQTFFVPTPSRRTVFLRRFVPWQLVKFAWINLKMIRMISIGNHGRAPDWQWREVPDADAPRGAAPAPDGGRPDAVRHTTAPGG